jgi:hypothetical protein
MRRCPQCQAAMSPQWAQCAICKGSVEAVTILPPDVRETTPACESVPALHEAPLPHPSKVVVGVRWARTKGYIEVTNPLDGHRYEVLAKGLPAWIFDRLPAKQKEQHHGEH